MVKVNETLITIMFLLEWLCIYSSGPTINRNLNSAKMHFCSKFGHPRLNRWGFIYDVDKLRMEQIFIFKFNLTLKVKVNSPIK